MNLRLLSAERAAVAQHDFFCAIAFYTLLCRRCYKGKRLVTSSFAVPICKLALVGIFVGAEREENLIVWDCLLGGGLLSDVALCQWCRWHLWKGVFSISWFGWGVFSMILQINASGQWKTKCQKKTQCLKNAILILTNGKVHTSHPWSLYWAKLDTVTQTSKAHSFSISCLESTSCLSFWPSLLTKKKLNAAAALYLCLSQRFSQMSKINAGGWWETASKNTPGVPWRENLQMNRRQVWPGFLFVCLFVCFIMETLQAEASLQGIQVNHKLLPKWMYRRKRAEIARKLIPQ